MVFKRFVLLAACMLILPATGLTADKGCFQSKDDITLLKAGIGTNGNPTYSIFLTTKDKSKSDEIMKKRQSAENRDKTDKAGSKNDESKKDDSSGWESGNFSCN